MEILIGIAIFILIVLLIEGFYYAFRTMRNPERMAVRKRLSALPTSGYEIESIDITRKRFLSEVPWLNRFLLIFHWTELHRLLEQAGIQRPPGFFILLSLFLALGGS